MIRNGPEELLQSPLLSIQALLASRTASDVVHEGPAPVSQLHQLLSDALAPPFGTQEI